VTTPAPPPRTNPQETCEAFTGVRDELSGRTFTLPEFTDAALPLAEPIDVYFDEVMVMANDPAVRANRLGFLAAVRDLVGGVLAWREIT
jgi:glycyl-tRNA synthetase